MHALVTGATGFVGSAVARHLLAHGHRVRAMVRAHSDQGALDGLDVETVHGDLAEPASLPPVLEGCEALFHVAADYRLWHPEPESVYRINVEGTRALMQAALAAGVQRIVYTSSVATLGLPANGGPGDETTPVGIDDMVGHYKRSKYLAEEAVHELARERGLPAVIVNPSTPVGPGDRKPTPTGRMVVDAATGRMPAYVDTGLNVVHVDDVAVGHLLAYEHGAVGRRYVLGGTDMKLQDILAEVTTLAGRRPPRVRLPRRALFPAAVVAEAWARASGREPRLTVDSLRMAGKLMYFSSARAERELGYRARPPRQALADAVAWFREHGYA